MNTESNQIRFLPEENEFLSDLRQEVKDYFTRTGKDRFGDKRMHFKVVVMFVVYFSLYVAMIL